MLGRGHEIMKGYDVWRRARAREIVIKQSGLERRMDNNILMAGDFYEGQKLWLWILETGMFTMIVQI